jgi:hypothetical protein
VLRCSPGPKKDDFGGQLVLVAPHPLTGLSPGQFVQVEGKVVMIGLTRAFQVTRLTSMSNSPAR